MEFEQLREFAHSIGRTSVTALPIGAKQVTGGRKIAAENSNFCFVLRETQGRRRESFSGNRLTKLSSMIVLA
jgi:hypothetical protein